MAGADWEEPPSSLTPAPSSDAGGKSPARSSKRSRGPSTESEEKEPSPPPPAGKGKGKAKGKGKDKAKTKDTSKEQSETSAPKTAKKRRNVSGYTTPASDSQFLQPSGLNTMRPRSRQGARQFEGDGTKSFEDIRLSWGGSSSGGSQHSGRR